MDNKYKAQNIYQKNKMKNVQAKFNNNFVEMFNDALENLDITQSDVIRMAMIEYISINDNQHVINDDYLESLGILDTKVKERMNHLMALKSRIKKSPIPHDER